MESGLELPINVAKNTLNGIKFEKVDNANNELPPPPALHPAELIVDGGLVGQLDTPETLEEYSENNLLNSPVLLLSVSSELLKSDVWLTLILVIESLDITVFCDAPALSATVMLVPSYDTIDADVEKFLFRFLAFLLLGTNVTATKSLGLDWTVL